MWSVCDFTDNMSNGLGAVVYRHTPVHIGGLEPLSTGELDHHLGLLNGIRFI